MSGKKKSMWKRILAGMGVVLVLSDAVGTNVWQSQAADMIAEYVENEASETEIKEAENLESDETEIDILEQENEDIERQKFGWLEENDEEKIVDQADQQEAGEEEQILDGQEDSSAGEQIQEPDDSLNWSAVEIPDNTEFITEKSAEAGTALDGGFLSGRSVRRARMAIRFQNCYGDQLDAGSREVYDTMTEAWAGGGTESFTVKFQEPLTFQATGSVVDGKWKWIAADAKTTAEKMELDPAFGEAIEALRCYVQGAFDACIYDNPEIFWLKNVSYSYSWKWETQEDGIVQGKITSVTISGNESAYWNGAKECISQFQTEVAEAVETISSSFADDMTDAQKMKQIHDYICAKCVYTIYPEKTTAFEQSHSAYGTFYNGKVVCEGYAKAFKILCNRMGLTCVLGSGIVHKSTSDGAHMWNYVLLDGGWYMVDATWDDGNKLSNRYLFAGAQTKGFYYAIAQERTNYTIFSKEPYGYKFVQPALQEDTYHEKIEAGYIPASCESSGQQTWRCQLCNEITQEEILAVGHSFGEWKIITKASCEQSGVQSRTCQNCQKTKTETVPATGHSFGAWETTTKASCEQSGVQSRICQNCQKTETETLPATGHSYDAWQISRGATVLEEGEMRRSCQNVGCSSYQTKSIAKLPGFVRLNASRITLQTRQSTSGLKVTDMAEGDRIIGWKSNKSSVATVNKNGKITGKKAGTAVITVTLASGVTGQCKVKVQKKAVAVAGLDISLAGLRGGQLILKKGQSVTCNATVKPFTCKTKVTYSSGNSKIAKISKNGKIRAVKNGKTKITIRAGKKKKVIWVTVKK